ncbi:3-coathanger stack domain-containing protein [Emticicia sp. 17c]|uniref:3-coathanger stack domain-containing protein n=1 Tax=Emticicia sp. 17c TaxID=3127704 RepID=UPI00301BE02A
MSGKKTSLQIITCLLVLLTFLRANAQNTSTIIEWQRCYGWDSWYGDEGIRIAPTKDGNFITLGKKTLQGYENIVTSKVNAKGEILWETIIFDTQVYTGFRGFDVIQHPDGGYILVGQVVDVRRLSFVSTDLRQLETNTGFHGYIDMLVVKLDSKGQKEWFKLIGGSAEDVPVRTILTPDNNIMLLGYTSSNDQDMYDTGKNNDSFNRDVWVAKLNSSGTIISKKCFGGNSDDIPFDMKRLADGNYVIVGSSNSTNWQAASNKGGKDVFAIKIDESLNTIWQKSYGSNQNDEGRRIIELPNGDLILGVVSNALNGDFELTPSSDFPENYQENIWLTRLNAGGDMLNKKIFGGVGRDILNDLILTKDGNCTFVGSTNSSNGSITDRNRIPNNNNSQFDVFLMKTTTNFDVIWSKTIGGSGIDEGFGLVETPEQEMIVIGTTTSFDGDVTDNHYSQRDSRDIWLVRLGYLCENNIVTSIDLVASNKEVLASQSINTSDRIRDGSVVKYSATRNVDLTTGFNIELGSTLEVNLQGCNNDNSPTNSNPIQVKTNNECREGGMKFTFFPYTPDKDLGQYRMSIQNLDPAIEFKFSGNTLITKNNVPDNRNAYYLLTVSRDGYKDFVVQGYTSTCEHDGAPIDCPENTSDVILDKEYYKEGDIFTATWTGELIPNQTLEWYNENVTLISKTGKTMIGRIDSFPAHIQAQPGVFPTYRPCHGAVRVDFRKAE